MEDSRITAHSGHMVRPFGCTFVTRDGKTYVTHVTEDPEVLKPWEENMNDNSPLPKTNVEIPMPSVKPPRDSSGPHAHGASYGEDCDTYCPIQSREFAVDRWTANLKNVSASVLKSEGPMFADWYLSHMDEPIEITKNDSEEFEFRWAEGPYWLLRTAWLTDIKPVWKPRKGDPVMYRVDYHWKLGWLDDLDTLLVYEMKGVDGELYGPVHATRIRPVSKASHE